MKRSEFEAKVMRLRPYMVRRAARRVGYELAEDAAQDAMIVAFSKPEWQEIKHVSLWVASILDNAVSNQQRKEDRAKRRGELQTFEEVPDMVDAVLDDMETAQRIGEIMEAASRAGLTRREDYIFLARLRDVEYADIARTLGVEAASVRASYSWALRKIRAVMRQGA